MLIIRRIKNIFNFFSSYAKRLRIDYSIFASSNKERENIEKIIKGHVAQR